MGIGDMIYIVLILSFTALVAILLNEPGQMIVEDFENDTSIDPAVKTYVSEYYDWVPSFWDTAIIVVFGFLVAALWISSYFIDSHPIFAAVFFILLVILLIAMGYFSNMYTEFSVDDSVSGSIPSFPKTHWLMGHWPHVLVVVGVIEGIVLFAKWRLQQ